MSESERTALEHIRRVVDSILGESTGENLGLAADVSENALRMLKVPYISQRSIESEQDVYDSGATAGAMLVHAYTDKKPSPVEFFARIESDTALNLQQVAAGLNFFGVTVEPRISLRLGDLALVLTSGRPMVLMIKQDVLREAGLTKEVSALPHFVVAVGVDVEQFYIHDPLHQDASGEGQGIPFLVLYRAWTQTVMDRAALIPRQTLIRRVRIIAKALNVREAPDETAKIVDIARSGDLFEITRQRGVWGMIGENRWVSMRYVQDV